MTGVRREAKPRGRPRADSELGEPTQTGQNVSLAPFASLVCLWFEGLLNAYKIRSRAIFCDVAHKKQLGNPRNAENVTRRNNQTLVIAPGVFTFAIFTSVITPRLRVD